MADGDPGNDPGGTPVMINADILGEYKDDPVFKAFEGKGIGDVFKSYKNAQGMIGGEKLVIPAGKLDTPENWQHVFDKLGRPKDATGYKLERPELPGGMAYDEKLEGEFKSACHALGILPKQAAGIYALWNKHQGDAFKTFEESESKRAAETEDALIKELGTKAKYDEYVKGADSALKRFGGDPQAVQAFIDKFGNDPLVVKVFGNVAKGMMEDAALRGDQSFNLMGEDAVAQVKDIQSNKNNKYHEAYWSNSHPLHQAAVDEVYRLQTLIHGDKVVGV